MAETTEWEYHLEVLGTAFKGVKPEELELVLNNMGMEGWEVISIHQLQNSPKFWVTAKRPLTDAARRQRRRQQEWSTG